MYGLGGVLYAALTGETPFAGRTPSEVIQKVLHPEIGWRVWNRNFPGQISGFDLSIPRAAPMVGEHNEEVLSEVLGLSDEELAQLERDGIIGRDPIDPPEVQNLDPDRMADYPGIREHDPDYRKRLGLDDPA